MYATTTRMLDSIDADIKQIVKNPDDETLYTDDETFLIRNKPSY